MRRQHVKLVNGVTVLGNLAIDVIDGAPRSPGGCASFAGVALEATGWTPAGIVAMGAEEDHALFDPLLERFGDLVRDLAVGPDERVPTGLRRRRPPPHVGRGDRTRVGRGRASRPPIRTPPGCTSRRCCAPTFPRQTLANARRARPSRRLRRTGPGPRRPAGSTGREPRLPARTARPHRHPQAGRGRSRRRRGRRFDAEVAERLGVPEILVTYGSEGCDIYTEETSSAFPRRGACEMCRPQGPATCSPPVMSPTARRAPIRGGQPSWRANWSHAELEKRPHARSVQPADRVPDVGCRLLSCASRGLLASNPGS